MKHYIQKKSFQKAWFPSKQYHYNDLFKKYIIESQKQIVISKDSEINELKIELQKQKDKIEQLKSKLTSEKKKLKEIESNLVTREYDNHHNTACNVKNDTCCLLLRVLF